MMQPDTRDLSELRLRLRDGLRRVEQEFAGGPCVVVEDPITSRFYRVGQREAEFLKLLDGSRSARDALAAHVARNPESGLSLADANQICQWLLANQLAIPAEAHLTLAADREESERPSPLRTSPGRADRGGTLLSYRLPLGSPDRLLARIQPWCSWCLGPIGLMVWFLALAAGCWTLVERWPEVMTAATHVVDPHRAWRIGLVFVGLKVLHEFAHALACRRHGGTVGNVGICFVFFSPLPYVDVTSTWRMASKWRRIQVSLAGVYAEWFVAAVAAWVWGHSLDPVVRQSAFEILLLSSVATMVVNGNPLMRFDGYFALSDWLGIPNLYDRGRRAVAEWGRNWVFATAPADRRVDETHREAWGITVYGWACLVWGQLVIWGLVVAAAAMWEGAGLVLAATVVLGCYVLPLIGRIRAIASEGPRWRDHLSRLAWFRIVGASVAAAGLLLVLWQTPLPDWWGATGVVSFPIGCEVRASTPGFIEEILVDEGTLVEAGQVLLRLRNDDLAVERADIERQLDAARIVYRRQVQRHSIAAAQAEEEHIASLRNQLAVLTRRLEELTIRAPKAGRVVATGLADRRDTFLSSGEEVLRIHQAGEEEIELALSQYLASQYRLLGATPVEVRVRGIDGVAYDCQVIAVEPRGDLRLVHPALSAAAGGTIPVQASDSSSAASDHVATTTRDEAASRGEAAPWGEATQPFFTARLRPCVPLPSGLPIGTRCQASLRQAPQTIGDWVRKRIGQEWGVSLPGTCRPERA